MKSRMAGKIAYVAVLLGTVSMMLAANPPPRPVSPLAGPTQALSAARANLLKAKAAVDVIRRRLLPAFENKPDWKAAKENLDAAHAEMDAATKHLVAKLDSDPEYKTQIARRDKAQAIIDHGTAVAPSADDNAPKVTDEDISNAHADRIDAAYALLKIEKKAQEDDTRYVASRLKYKEAAEQWETVQSQLEDAVKLDPAYPAAGKAVDDAEAAVKQAQDQYNAAVRAQANSHNRR